MLRSMTIISTAMIFADLIGPALADLSSDNSETMTVQATASSIVSMTIDDAKAGLASGDDFGNSSVNKLLAITDADSAAQTARFTVRANVDYDVLVTTDVFVGPPFIVLPGLPVRGNSIYAKFSSVTTNTNFMAGWLGLIDPNDVSKGWNFATGTVGGSGVPGTGQWILGAGFVPGIAGSNGQHSPGLVALPDNYRATAIVTVAMSR